MRADQTTAAASRSAERGDVASATSRPDQAGDDHRAREARRHVGHADGRRRQEAAEQVCERPQDADDQRLQQPRSASPRAAPACRKTASTTPRNRPPNIAMPRIVGRPGSWRPAHVVWRGEPATSLNSSAQPHRTEPAEDDGGPTRRARTRGAGLAQAWRRQERGRHRAPPSAAATTRPRYTSSRRRGARRTPKISSPSATSRATSAGTSSRPAGEAAGPRRPVSTSTASARAQLRRGAGRDDQPAWSMITTRS